MSQIAEWKIVVTTNLGSHVMTEHFDGTEEQAQQRARATKLYAERLGNTVDDIDVERVGDWRDAERPVARIKDQHAHGPYTATLVYRLEKGGYAISYRGVRGNRDRVHHWADDESALAGFQRMIDRMAYQEAMACQRDMLRKIK